MPFNDVLSGFNNGITQVMRVQDFKDRRKSRKKQDEWDLEDRDYLKRRRSNEETQFKKSQDLQKLNDLMNFEEGIGSLTQGDHGPLFSDQFRDAINSRYKDDLQEGDGKNKSVSRLIPDEQGQGVYIDLNAEDENNKKYNAPLSVNRSNRPDDPPRLVPTETLFELYSQAQKEINEMDIPKAEKDKVRKKVRAGFKLAGGDKSDLVSQQKQQETLSTRQHDKDLIGLKHKNALDLLGRKNSNALKMAGVKSNKSSSKPTDPRLKNKDILSAIVTLKGGKLDPFGNFSVPEGNSDQISVMADVAQQFERASPVSLGAAEISNIAIQASQGLPLSVAQAEEMVDAKLSKPWGANQAEFDKTRQDQIKQILENGLTEYKRRVFEIGQARVAESQPAQNAPAQRQAIVRPNIINEPSVDRPKGAVRSHDEALRILYSDYENLAPAFKERFGYLPPYIETGGVADESF